MSPRKQPLSLFEICRKSISHKIIFDCHKYCKCNNHPYEQIVQRGNVVCPDELLPMKRYLLENLPNDLFDHLCNETLLSLSCKIGRTSAREYENVLKVILSLFVHSNMRIFYPKVAHGNSFIRSPVPDIDSFWISMLCSSKKLVVLSLYKVCTDVILEVVGTNCSLLEVIDITSKTSSFERNKMLNINALRLKYFVTDSGLAHLSKCKRLREVHMNSLSANHHARRMVTQNGIQQLVRSLPALTFISYKAMGTIVHHLNLDENACPLPLMHIEEDNCKPEHIRAMSNLCRNLKSLVLLKHMHVFSTNTNVQLEQDIMSELCVSELKLEHLTLQFWPYTEFIFKFIKLKGHHLRTLRIMFFMRCGTLSSNDLSLIGQYCPNVEILHLDPVTVHDSDLINVRSANKKHFANMTSLSFHGYCWLPEVCFVMCIRNAVNLRTLYLTRDDLPGIVLDDHISNLLKYNSLSELQDLNLGRGLYVSKYIVYKLIEQCANLKNFAFSNECLDPIAESEILNYVTVNNFKLSVHFDD
ncbi:hypothetical protein LSTR_LSTR002154 [Laodelphax striatellus]|uniref:F-box domain-containing protein n=1 Tax=Laodelphax striatellus TaxID=195883 RepID=A0A482XRK6_LAOST|nr:hypothetical protein LSTR_LSTR002154 [Laodelphax striatellus]